MFYSLKDLIDYLDRHLGICIRKGFEESPSLLEELARKLSDKPSKGDLEADLITIRRIKLYPDNPLLRGVQEFPFIERVYEEANLERGEKLKIGIPQGIRIYREYLI